MYFSSTIILQNQHEKNAINQNCLKKRSELEIVSYRKKNR